MRMYLFNPTTQFRSFVYRNLAQDCWSVKALEGPNKGRVVLHAKYVAVTGRDGDFKVSQAGRERVLRERRKNVHAGVIGSIFWADVIEERYPLEASHKGDYVEGYQPDVIAPGHMAYRPVSYNPYNNSEFVWGDTGEAAQLVDRDDSSIILDGGMKVYVMSTAALAVYLRETMEHEWLTDKIVAG